MSTVRKASSQNYWIQRGAISFTLNALGDPDKISVSVAAGAVIMAYAKIDGTTIIDYNAGHNYRAWALRAAPTHFVQTDKVYVYARLDRVGDTALIIYPYEEIDIAPDNSNYYYIYLGTLTASTDASGNKQNRGWEGGTSEFANYGTLDTDQQRNEQGSDTLQRMFNLNGNGQIEVLKDLLFLADTRLLTLRMRSLAGNVDAVINTITTTHNIVDGTFTGVDTSLPTTAAMVAYALLREKLLEQKFLRKDQNDATPYKLTMGEAEVTGDATIGGDATVQGNTTLNGTTQVNGNMTFGGGYQEGVQGGKVSILNGGLVKMQVDYLDVTKKMSAKEVEIQKVSHIGGKLMSTAARMICSRVVKAKIYTSELTNVDAFICFFENEDSDGRRIYNLFRKGDQAYCQTFNIEEGTSTDFANTYYWRLVIATSLDALVGGAQPTSEAWTGATSDLPQGTYTNCIVFIDDEPIGEDTDYTALNSTEPQAGDEIVQLGYRPQAGDTEEVILGRQGAIIQTASASVIDVNNPSVPSLAMYKGIDSFALPREPFVIFSPAKSKISSDVIQLESGETLDEVVDERYIVYQSEKKSKEDPDGVAAEMQAYIDRWTTPEDVRDEHVGDFFLAADGFCWMYYRDEETDPATYLWRTVDDEYLTAYVNEISKRTKTFVFGIGEQPYQPNVTYKVGDIWADVDMTFPPTQSSPGVKYDKITLVCISARAKGDDFSIVHWKEWDGTRQLVVNQSATIQQIENNIGDIDASIGSINSSIGDINQGLWVGTDLVWYVAVDNPTGNPRTKGYYELDTYNKPQETEDTSVVSGKTYYERKKKQRAGLVTTDDFAGLLVKYNVGTKDYISGEISVSLQSAKDYTDGKAEDAEAHAKEYADGKSATYRSENIPNTPYNEGDLWVKPDSTNGNLTYRCTTSRAVGETTSMSDWELATDVDKRISVATIQADKIVLSNDTKVPLFKVEGGQVWTANLTIEGFMNRKAMELTNNNLISVAYPCEDSTSSIAPMAERATIQMTSYSLDLLLCTDTIVFDFNSDMVTFVLPSYARLDMNDADPYAYIRPCTKYQTATKKGMLMTLAQMRMLVGRKFVFINRGKANVIFQIGTLFNITHDDIITLPSTPNYDYEVGIGANKMGVFELRSGEYQGKDEYGADEWHECLYWRFSESDSRTLNEFIDT